MGHLSHKALQRRMLGLPSAAVLFLAALATFSTASRTPSSASTPRPKIIVTMIIDDLGWADTSLEVSDPDIDTPNLKYLADNGVRISQMHSQPVCSPTRSALMTGRFPFRDGMQHKNTIVPASTAALPLSTPTLPELFKKYSNVTSSMVGKWHLGSSSYNNTPVGRGFDNFVGYMQGQVDYFNKTVAVGYGRGYDFWDGDTLDRSAAGNYSLTQYKRAWEKYIHEFVSNLRADAETQHIENRHLSSSNSGGVAQQLYLYLAFQTVHIPIEAAGEDARCTSISDYWRRVYCSMMVELDDAVASLLKTLTAAVGKDFVILAMSDNGAQVRWATHGGNATHNAPFWPASTGDNRPLRGSKFTLFQGGIQATSFIYSPSLTIVPESARGTTYSGLMHACDFAATALALGGVDDTVLETKIDGINHWEALTQSASKSLRDHLPINIVSKGQDYTAVRFGDLKLIVGNPQYGIKATGWFSGGLSPESELAPSHKKGTPYLFNITNDPTEHHELDLEMYADAVKLGKSIISSYVQSGSYAEPQSNYPHLAGFPFLHDGAWVPWLK